MTSEGLWEMFEGDSAHTCAGKFPQVPMGVRAEGPACAGREARPPSALADFFLSFFQILTIDGTWKEKASHLSDGFHGLPSGNGSEPVCNKKLQNASN